MEPKKYSSYAEIDRELEILKLEKEIQFKKVILGIQKTSESFEPQNIIKNLIKSYKSNISSSYIDIIQLSLPLIIKWFINKKRGY